jgi:plasmid maintenance system antidote protein VapI
VYADMVQRIARAIGTSVQSWLAMQIALDMWQYEKHLPEEIQAIQPF